MASLDDSKAPPDQFQDSQPAPETTALDIESDASQELRGDSSSSLYLLSTLHRQRIHKPARVLDISEDWFVSRATSLNVNEAGREKFLPHRFQVPHPKMRT